MKGLDELLTLFPAPTNDLSFNETTQIKSPLQETLVNFSTQGQNLAHMACIYKDLELIDWILKKEVFNLFNEIDKEGNTPLHYLAFPTIEKQYDKKLQKKYFKLNIKIIERLKNASVPIEIKENNLGLTPVELAQQYNKLCNIDNNDHIQALRRYSIKIKKTVGTKSNYDINAFGKYHAIYDDLWVYFKVTKALIKKDIILLLPVLDELKLLIPNLFNNTRTSIELEFSTAEQQKIQSFSLHYKRELSEQEIFGCKKLALQQQYTGLKNQILTCKTAEELSDIKFKIINDKIIGNDHLRGHIFLYATNIRFSNF